MQDGAYSGISDDWSYLPPDLKCMLFGYLPPARNRELNKANSRWLEAGWAYLVKDSSNITRKRLYNLLKHYEECQPFTKKILSNIWAVQGSFSFKANLSVKLRLLLTLYDFEAHKTLNEVDAKFVYLAACNPKYAPYAWTVIVRVLMHHNVGEKFDLMTVLKGALNSAKKGLSERTVKILSQIIPYLEAKQAADLLLEKNAYAWLTLQVNFTVQGSLSLNIKSIQLLLNRLDIEQATNLSEALMARLKPDGSEEWWIRDYAAQILGQLINRLEHKQILDIIVRLTEALKDPDWKVRESAARALGEVASHLDPIHSVDLVTPLELALNSLNVNICKAAAHSLGKINSEIYGYRFRASNIPLLTDLILMHRLDATQLENLNAVLTEILQNMSLVYSSVRVDAVRFLGLMARRLKDVKQVANIIAQLTKMISHLEEDVRIQAIKALDPLANRFNVQQAINLIPPLIAVSEHFGTPHAIKLLGKLMRHLLDAENRAGPITAFIQALASALKESGHEILGKAAIKALKGSIAYLDAKELVDLFKQLKKIVIPIDDLEIDDPNFKLQIGINGLISVLESYFIREKVTCSEEKTYAICWEMLQDDVECEKHVRDMNWTTGLELISIHWCDADMHAGFDVKKIPKPIIPVPEAFLDICGIHQVDENVEAMTSEMGKLGI